MKNDTFMRPNESLGVKGTDGVGFGTYKVA